MQMSFPKLLIRSSLALGLAVLTIAVALSKPQRDFIEYWTVAHLFVQGENCYSLPEVFHFQKALNWPEPLPLIPLNPPWLLPFLAPLGLLHSYAVGWTIWTVVMTGALAVSSLLLMELYAPDVRLPEVSDSLLLRALFIFSFYPVILSVRFAQISGLILLGIVAFLWLQRNGYLTLSGSALALAALKPQLAYLVFLTMIVVSWRRRSLRTMAGFVSAMSLFTVIAWLINPSAFRGYYELATGPYAQVYPSAVGAILRWPFRSGNTFYLQFVPMLFGLTWLFFFLNRRPEDWSWLHAMPTLIGASVLTTPWGWLFDQAILAVPIVALFSETVRSRGELPRKMVWLYTALNVGIILASLMESFPLFYAVTPCVLLIMLPRSSGAAGIR
jgi:glycosyl transferase family 87